MSSRKKAVALVLGGRRQGEVSRDLGVSAWSLGEWIKKAKAGHVPTQAATFDAESNEQRESSGANRSAAEMARLILLKETAGK